MSPVYGLENAYGYGRSLLVWLVEKGYHVKDVNPSLAYDQRKSAQHHLWNDEEQDGIPKARNARRTEKICFVVRKGMVYFFKIEDKNFTARERSQLSI